DDTHLLSSGTDGTIRLWDTRWQPMIGRGGVAWARFFDDGRRIGSVEVDKGDAGTTVRWWDTSTGLPIGNPVHIVDSAINKLYLVDERRALSFGSAVTAQLWDARTGLPLGQPLPLSPDPRRIVVADDTTNPRIAATVESGEVKIF